ncbi:MAG: gamma-glutamyltransferase family protein [Saccharospirillum sp.]|nr:gamma-glutamyltransferase family protein [Saccharospirillum sp.]
MQFSNNSRGGMVVAPHYLAAEAGRDVLRAGGTAVEAVVAAAASIAVVYPHMNAIGGDGFWLIHEPGKAPVAIDASGVSARAADRYFYAGHASIPERGPLAALTVAGTISGWQEALALSQTWSSPLPLSDLLHSAVRQAREGVAVTRSQAELTRQKLASLQHQPGFAETFLNEGNPPEAGDLQKLPDLADTLMHLAEAGLDDFYRGDLGQTLGKHLADLGSPLTAADLADYRASRVTPLQLKLKSATLFNHPPPTQGLASLIILGLFERLQTRHSGNMQGESFAHLHALIEATKQAFLVRDRVVTDPGRLPLAPESWLTESALQSMLAGIDDDQALPWPQPAKPGDTVWLGAVDSAGRAVSFIQSIYWEFGSGVVVPGTGVTWQNRGISFSLNPADLNALEPGRKPFHTLNPALALFDDGRVMPYGTMGGEGQPQTQAAVFSRYAHFGQNLADAIAAPRWLLGRTWGEESTSLKLESRIDEAVVKQLKTAGHEVAELDEAFSDTMGHAGALVRHADGEIEGASDPRCDGTAAAV